MKQHQYPHLDEATDGASDAEYHEPEATEAQSDDDVQISELDLDDAAYSMEQDTEMASDTIDLSLDEIQTLPLDSVVTDDSEDLLRRQQEIATLEAIVFDGLSPQHSASETSSANSESPHTESGMPLQNQAPQNASQALSDGADSTEQAAAEKVVIPAHIAAHSEPKPLPKTSSNPFLPQHILDRLNDGRRNLVEEIARSGAALESSTAMLRARTQGDRTQRAFNNQIKQMHAESGVQDADAQSKQQLIDQIVEEYLPLLAAELRKRLKAQLD